MHKTLSLLLGALLISGTTLAQPPPISSAAIPAEGGASGAIFDEAQLEQLLGPIALYPDALIALVLPASTAPTDIVLAARYLSDFGGDLSQVENRAWDDSVKSLTHYPDVLKWMDQNLTWTKQLGDAFTSQPAAVMNAIQRLRARARAAGTLVDTPQQQVVVEPDAIAIVPAQPDVIYVPSYDPDLVYVSRPAFYGYTKPYFSFGVGYPTGLWLAYNLDWSHRRVSYINRPDRLRYWQDHRTTWHRPYVSSRQTYTPDPFHRAWTPPAPTYRRPSPYVGTIRTQVNVVRPAPFADTRRNFYRDDRTDGSRAVSPYSRPAQNPAPSGPRPRYNNSTTSSPNSAPAPADAPLQQRYTSPLPPAAPAPTTQPSRSTQPQPQYDRRGGRTGDERGESGFRAPAAVPQASPAPAPASRNPVPTQSTLSYNRASPPPPPQTSPTPATATPPAQNPPARPSSDNDDEGNNRRMRSQR